MAVSSASTTGRIIDSVTVPARSAGAEASRLPLLVRNPRRHADHPVADEGHGIVGLQRQKRRPPLRPVEGPDLHPPARMGDDALEGVQPPPADSVDADHNQGIVSGVYAPTTIAHADSDDRAVLVALYNATAWDNWVSKDNWMGDEPLGQWYGVTADGNGRVTELRLSENRLSGELSEELGNLVNLQVLIFGGGFTCDSGGCRPDSPSPNRLAGEIPAELGSLANLELLSLDANQLSGEIRPGWVASPA